jgi:hypothetical protein
MIQNQGKEENALWLAFRFIVYMGVVFDLGSTVSAVYILILGSSLPMIARDMALRDKTSLPYRALHAPERTFPYEWLTGTRENELDILKRCGMGKVWARMAYYMVVSFVFGLMCLFLSILLWAWGTEVKGLAIAVTIGVAAGAVPALVFIGSVY